MGSEMCIRDRGYASAIAMVLFLLILVINLIQLSLERFVNYDT